MISDWPHSVNRPNRRRPRCRVAAAAPPCDDAMQRAAHPSSPPHLPYMFRPTLMADGAAAPRGWLAARQRAWADTHPIYIGDTHFLGYDCLNEKRDIASAYGYSDFGSMILDNVEDLSFLLDRLPITARNLRLDVASRMFILVWALSFKIIPPSILVGRSIHDLKLMVASKDPFRKCAKVALAALHTTHGYSNFADHKKFQLKYNEKHYPHLLSKGTGIASAFISDGAVSKVRQNLAQRWTLKGDTSSLEIITVKERCTGYSHYGLTVEPHEANLQPLVTINLRTQPQAEAFAKQVDVQPFMSE